MAREVADSRGSSLRNQTLEPKILTQVNGPPYHTLNSANEQTFADEKIAIDIGSDAMRSDIVSYNDEMMAHELNAAQRQALGSKTGNSAHSTE